MRLLRSQISHPVVIGAVFVALPIVSSVCLYLQYLSFLTVTETVPIPTAELPRVTRAARLGYELSALMIAVLSGLGWLVIRKRIGTPLSTLAARLGQMRQGDLTGPPLCDSLPAIAELTVHVDAHTTELARRVDDATAAVGITLTDLDSLRLSADQTARSAEHQSAHTSEVAATLEELSFSTTDIARSAAESADIASRTKEAAVKGSMLADAAAHNVQHVASFTQELNRTVDRLNRRVSEIGEISTVVKDIAGQTKLLALNASIEAARDGNGGGFSVVAAEVRRLAELTVRETAQISNRIRSVQEESERTTQSMHKTTSQVDDILRNVKDVLDTLSSIVDISTKSKERIAQIAEAVEFQSRAMTRISNTMEQSSQISVGIFKMAGGVSTQVDAIVSTIGRLRSSFLDYATHDRDRLLLELALADHRQWSRRVFAHLRGESDLARRLLPDHRSCQLGGWYYAERTRRFADHPQFVPIEGQHVLLHSLAEDAIGLFEQGDRAAAVRKIPEMDAAMQQLTVLCEGLLPMQRKRTEVAMPMER